MAGLKALDHVAYIRFASIYKDFSDPATSPKSPSASKRKRRRRPATTNCCERPSRSSSSSARSSARTSARRRGRCSISG